MLVRPSGPVSSPLLALVGEAPGEQEERQGQPFVGPSGHLLTQMLSAAGIARSECFITNVSNIRPPNNEFKSFFYEGKHQPTGALLDQRERLWKEIRAVNPTVVVALGDEAMKALTGKHGINNYRGTMIEENGLRVIPTYHPAYLLRGNYGDRVVVEADLRKAHRQALRPSKPKTIFQLDPNFSEVMHFLNSRPERVAADIESLGFGRHWHTRCIGFAWSRTEAISIPLISNGNHHWTQDQETEILKALDEFFRSEVQFYLQNSPYDFTVLAKEFGFSVPNLRLDTMFAHHLLYPALPKGLDFISSIYTDHPMYWQYHKGNEKEVWEYNCIDCVVTFEGAEELEKELHERNQWDFYQNILKLAVPALTRMQSRGILVDEVRRLEFDATVEKELTDLRIKINTLLGEDLNPHSPKQVSALVYDKWKLPVQKKAKQLGRTSDEDALKTLIRKSTDPTQIEIMRAINLARQKRVLLSTFVRMELDNGRARTSYNLAGTVTGRLASSSTIEGFGGNLQNIPRGAFRRVFVADPGKVLIKADLSQAEYRVLIWRARIHRVIQKFADPTFSIHWWNASENIYKKPRDQITKQQYDEAKNGTYGANYGIGPPKVSRMYDIELGQAKRIIDNYHTNVPEIKGVYQTEIRELIQSTRCLTNPLGRSRLFFGRMDDELYRSAYSHYCQSTVADLIYLGLITLDAGPSWLELLLQVHDELVCQVPDDPEHIREGCRLIKSAMEIPLKFDGVDQPLVIPVEIKVGRDWGSAKGVEDYLKEFHLDNVTV